MTTAERASVRLSPRQRDVLQMLWDGLSTKQIAEAMNLSYAYIKNVREDIAMALGVRGTVPMVRRALELRLLRLDVRRDVA